MLRWSRGLCELAVYCVNMIRLAVGICTSLLFVFAALRIVAVYEGRQCFAGKSQPFFLGSLTVVAVWIAGISKSEDFAPAVCSLAILLVLAVIDGQTGYVYDFFGFGGLFVCGLLAGMTWPELTRREQLFVWIYIVIVFLSGALRGIGFGDVFVYLAILFFYVRYLSFPADGALFMLMFSQSVCVIGFLIKRKKRIPLVPYIWMAHVVTLLLWE